MTPRCSRRSFLRSGLAALAMAEVGCSRVHHAWLGMKPFGGRINILIWDGYFSDEILDRFEREYGIQVNPTIFDSNEQLYDILSGHDSLHRGPFDLAMPSSFMAERLQQEQRLIPFQRRRGDNRFVNLTNLNPVGELDRPGEPPRDDNLDRAYNLDSDPNNDFSVPYIWGATGIGYNAEQVPRLPMSWGSFFVRDPSHRRRIAMMNDGRFVLGSALIYLLYQKYQGGISIMSPQEIAQHVAADFTNATEAQIRQAGELIKGLAEDVICINSDHIPEVLASDEASMAIAWSGDVAVAMLRGQVTPPEPGQQPVPRNLNIRISLPVEGVVVFRDVFVIPRGCRNQVGAERFLNYLVDPVVAGAVTNYCCYATTIRTATPIVDPDIANSAAYFIHPYAAKNIFLDNDKAARTDEMYNRVWDEVCRAFPPWVFKFPIVIPPPAGVSAPPLINNPQPQ